MASETTKGLVVLAAAAVGLLLVAVPWLPRTKDNPLPASFDLDSQAGRELLSALQWHDEACATGDVDGFYARVTDDYAKNLQRRLRQLGLGLNGETLREYVGADRSAGLARPVERGCRGGFADGDRACLIAVAPGGRPGVQAYEFRWDGERFRVAVVSHQPDLAPGDARAIAAFARRLVGAR